MTKFVNSLFLSCPQFELDNDIDRNHLKIDEHEHIDHDNEHTFEIEDLKKLILKTSQDLAEADRLRREEFKVSVIIIGIWQTDKFFFSSN